MTPQERRKLQKLDDMVLNASAEQLQEIQSVDSQTQLGGMSLYEHVGLATGMKNPE